VLGKFPNQPYEATPNTDVEPPTVSDKGKSCPPITITRPDVVSFPPLPSQQFTSDWFSPLPDMSAPASEDSKCLFGAGIDTRVADTPKGRNTSLLSVSGKSTPKGETGHRQESTSSGCNSNTRRKSVNPIHPQVCPRLGDAFKIGNAIGSSSGARRKSSTQSVRLKIDNEALEHHYHEDQTSWTKPRKDSGWPVANLPSPEEPDSRKSSHASPRPGRLDRDHHGKGKGQRC
jgi:hypothetical protein